MDAGGSAFTQGREQLSAQRIAEAHIVDCDVERLLRGADKRGEPRHDGVGGLFAFGEKEDGKIIQRSEIEGQKSVVGRQCGDGAEGMGVR